MGILLWCILKTSSIKHVKKTHIDIIFVFWVNAFNVPLVLSVYIVVSCVWWGDVYRYVWEKGEGKPGEKRRGEKEEREFYFLSNIYYALLMLIMKEHGQWPILWRAKY